MSRRAGPVEGVFERVAGSGVWYVRFRINGKLVRKSFGADRNSAVAYVEKARTLRRSGDGYVPATAKRPPRSFAEIAAIGTGTTINELCDDALRFSLRNHRDKQNPPTRIASIRAAFDQRPAESVTPLEITAWLEGLGVEAGTEARYKSTLSLCYREGMKNQKVTTNPARLVTNRRVPAGVLRYLLGAEEERLRSTIERRFPHHMPELVIALNTGMRKGEQYGLLWTDVDFASRRLMANNTKNGTPRTIHMNDDALAAMNDLRKMAIGERVFNIRENRTWWYEAIKDAKIANFRWHDLRHTFCSRLAQAGVNLKVIQEAAGHKTIAMTSRYAHLDHTTLQNALAVLNRPTVAV
ncbi:MAG: site-specific integrase [Acidobacteriaceae bacterium]|jgi:integrase